MNITVLDNEENFLQFLDPELCTLVETHEKGGLRTLSLDYKFQDLHEDKQLFKIGNKVWVSGDANLTDTLYVINTPVEINVYAENSFSMELEEVMVELNYAPIFCQTDLTSDNGFKITTTNGEQSVTINWNALNYWFGDYYNIGVVQKCLNENYNRVALSGTKTLMNLLRYIEEQTGNVFVTRYEKDPLTNVIHRYLDFLNPINVSKDWELNIEYDFVQGVDDTGVFDENGNPSRDEDEYADTESEDDLVDFTPTGTAWANINPSNVEFRITSKNYDIIYTDESEETPLVWTSEDIGFDDNANNVVITLNSVSNVVGLICNDKTFIIPPEEEYGVPYGNGYLDLDNIDDPVVTYTCSIPDDSYFTIYDTDKERTVYSTCINREIGHTHEEVLDIGFNLDNIIFETDESDTFTAMAPILNLEETDGLNKDDMAKVIGYWKSMSVTQGETLPMILEKIMVQASSLAAARQSLGTQSRTNYYTRPYHPQDNIDTNTPSNSEWEFYRATAYWKAPFTKNAGEMFISLDQEGSIEYTNINPRPDWREERTIRRPKIGNVETSDRSIYGIYNDVCMKLKDKMTPSFNITVDVANLRNGRYNDYQLHDKVYVKLPDYQELVTARVSKTVKEAHNVANNTIELDNYSINTVKNVQNKTYIDASNVSFKYPNSKQLQVRLVNEDYVSDPTDPNYDPYLVQYPKGKLISFVLYKVENGNSTLTKKSYTRLTNSQGYATINMKYDPGDYELSITFGGDEEYEGTSIIIDVNVSGTKTSKKTVKKTTKSKTVKKTTKSKKTNKTTKSTNKAKKVTSSKTRTSSYSQPSALKKKALSIVGDSTGLDAAKKIAKWCGTRRNFKYSNYKNYRRKASRAYKMRSANCCDSTRMMLSMMDAVGCSEKLKLEYVHCHNSAARKGHVFAKITTRATGKYRYVDPCCKLENGRSPWGNHLKGYGPIVSINAYTGPNSSPF